MGEVTAYRKKHWVVALDADLASIPSPADGDTALTLDKKKLYYWEGGAWKTGLGYEYVPRALAAADFVLGNFTTDGTWKVDGLDLSGIVPVGAKAVSIYMLIKDDAANTVFDLRTNGTTHSANFVGQRTQAANIEVRANGILPIDSDRLLDYFGANVAFTVILVYVTGWFI